MALRCGDCLDGEPSSQLEPNEVEVFIELDDAPDRAAGMVTRLFFPFQGVLADGEDRRGW